MATPTHRIVQLSDLHLTAGGEPLYGGVDTDAQLVAAFDRVAESELPIDAIILSGDLTDTGSADAYVRLRELAAEQSRRFGVPVLSGAGNHDRRRAFRESLLGDPSGDAGLDHVAEVRGLRIVHLDSSVPEAGHGEVTTGQLDWLRGVLAERADAGTVLVIHHPPVPTTSEIMSALALRNPEALVPVLAGSDVRLILSGHWHTAASSSFAGIPVAIAAGVSYAADPVHNGLGYRALAGDQSFNMVEFFPGQVVVTVVPIQNHRVLHDIAIEDIRAALSASAG